MSAVSTEEKPTTTFRVSVIYNGVTKSVLVNDHEVVQAVLQRAINEFGPLPNPHTLALFTTAGVELPDNAHVNDAGITPDTTLLLRPSAVKGGVA
jgi:hypothetical protein